MLTTSKGEKAKSLKGEKEEPEKTIMENIRTIALDSNCLTYLVEATIPGYDPHRDRQRRISQERLAMIRIPLYMGSGARIYVLPAIIDEYNCIPEPKRRFLHDNMMLLSYRPWPFDHKEIENRKQYFLSYHKREKDCQILAEAEAARINILLCNDNDFIRKLYKKANGVKMMRPSNYWGNLNIRPGTKPKLRPAESNPLSQQAWWLI